MKLKTWQWLTIGAALLALFKTMTTATDQVQRIAQAISVAEGYGKPGEIPTVRNNPGNIRDPSGAIGTYATNEDGWEALYRQVRAMLVPSSLYDPSWPLTEIARVYTGESAYMNWANNVAAVLGVSTDTPFGEL